MSSVKGLLFDYGGTLDSRGDHWSEVIFDAYRSLGVPVGYEAFREAYIFGERFLAANPVVSPGDTFLRVLQLKVEAQMQWLVDHGFIGTDAYSAAVAERCYMVAREATAESAECLARLAERYPMAIVSNFYGNLNAVLADFGLRQYFIGVAESATLGIRKPDPRIFEVGCTILDLKPTDVLIVGDSMSKDMAPAATIGCRTAYIAGRPWRGDASAGPARTPTTLPRLTAALLS